MLSAEVLFKLCLFIRVMLLSVERTSSQILFVVLAMMSADGSFIEIPVVYLLYLENTSKYIVSSQTVHI